eukprot:jgi/Chlat1/2702/Chrsp180S02863
MVPAHKDTRMLQHSFHRMGVYDSSEQDQRKHASEMEALRYEAEQLRLSLKAERHAKERALMEVEDMRTKLVATQEEHQRLLNVLVATQEQLESITAASRLQHLMLNSVGESIITTDQMGKIIFWNKNAERTYGWTIDEAFGKDIIDFVVPETDTQIAHDIMSSLVQGEDWTGEFPVLTRSGTRLHMLVTDRPILDENGQLQGVIGISRDISDRKRHEDYILEINSDLERRVRERTQALQDANKELSQVKNQLQLIMDAAADLILQTDADGNTIRFCNSAVTKHLGYAPEELIGKPSTILTDEKRATRLVERFQRLWDEHFETFSLMEQIQLQAKSGEYRWFQLQMTFCYIDGKCSHVITVGRDTSEQDKLQESLQRASAVEEACPDMLFQLDSERNITHVSPAVYDVLGYDVRELLGKSDYDYVYSEDLSRLISIQSTIAKQLSGDTLQAFLAGRKVDLQLSGFYKLRRVKKSGAAVWLDVNYRLYPDQKAKSFAFVTVERDISERIQQQLLRQRIAGALRQEEVKRSSPDLQNVLREALQCDGQKAAETRPEPATSETESRGVSEGQADAQDTPGSSDGEEVPEAGSEGSTVPGQAHTRRRRRRRSRHGRAHFMADMYGMPHRCMVPHPHAGPFLPHAALTGGATMYPQPAWGISQAAPQYHAQPQPVVHPGMLGYAGPVGQPSFFPPRPMPSPRRPDVWPQASVSEDKLHQDRRMHTLEHARSAANPVVWPRTTY